MRRMHTIVALIDCNNFYCSCERVFNAALRHRPVIVLSNNDGCVVARSNEVKALGVKMGQPVFEIRDLIEQHDVVLFSSNYPLYADMSARVMGTLASFAPRAEVYSIDEAFLDVSHIRPECLDAYGHEIRETVWRLTGIPVSVGIASTKTLAKVANSVVKHNLRYQGVLNLTPCTEEELDELLASLAIKDVWGIGPRYAHRLQASCNICTAKELKYTNEHWIRKRFSVVVQRTVLELRGIACIPLEIEPKPKQGIMTAKSFGRPVESLVELEEAISTYAARAAEKLRDQGSVAACISIFIQTNPFKADASQYAGSLTRVLPWSRRPARNLAARFQPSLPKPDRHLSAHPAFQGDGSTGIGFIPLTGSRPPPRPLGSVHLPLRPFPVSWALPQAVEYYDRSVTISLSADR